MVFRYFKYVFVHVFISVAYISRIVAFLIFSFHLVYTTNFMIFKGVIGCDMHFY